MRDVCSYETVRVENSVRDLMVLTVPRLALDEQMSLVEPDNALADDGLARRFAKEFQHDETPVMMVSTEVYDLMRLAYPGICPSAEELVEAEVYSCPDDGLEMAWSFETEEAPIETVEEVPVEVASVEESPVQVIVREFEVDEATCLSFAEFVASVDSYLEQPDWSYIGSISCCSAEVEEATLGVPDEFFVADEFTAGCFSGLMAAEACTIPVWAVADYEASLARRVVAVVPVETYPDQPDWISVSSMTCRSAEVEEVTIDIPYELYEADETVAECFVMTEFAVPAWVTEGYEADCACRIEAIASAEIPAAEPVSEPDWSYIGSISCCYSEVEEVFEVSDDIEEYESDSLEAPVWEFEDCETDHACAVSVFEEPVFLGCVEYEDVEIIDYAEADALIISALSEAEYEICEPTAEDLALVDRIAAEYMPVVCFSFGPETSAEDSWVVSFSF